MKITKPKDEEIPEYYRGYVGQCTEDDLIEALTNGLNDTVNLIKLITPANENFRYADGKWSVKEVLVHMIDTERVFGYRALTFSRKDATPLPGFHENPYAENSNAASRDMKSILNEFQSLRQSNIELFSGMNEDMLTFPGTANNNQMTAHTVGWIIAGHAKHHCKVLREKYLK